MGAARASYWTDDSQDRVHPRPALDSSETELNYNVNTRVRFADVSLLDASEDQTPDLLVDNLSAGNERGAPTQIEISWRSPVEATEPCLQRPRSRAKAGA